MKKLMIISMLAISTMANAQKDNFQKTDEVLAEVVKKALVVAEKTGNFVIEQAPSLLQEFYQWHLWADIFGIALGLAIFFSGRYFPYCFGQKEESGYYDERFFGRWFGMVDLIWVLFGVSTLISACFVFISLYDLIYLLVAPKLYLIDYFIK